MSEADHRLAAELPDEKRAGIGRERVLGTHEPGVLQLRELGGARGDLSGDPEAG
ncbi:hypothetical protein [Paraburkholderia susongensis]|uniref:hypothetical protein n=1 Tax=Paraburkholderia susongensis TaxID=1515439 RepID=UPI00142D72E5|nr:hypothetical protein [Paraburkholderia susongensis]